MEDIEKRLDDIEEKLSNIEKILAEYGKRITQLSNSALIDNPETIPDGEDDG